MGVLVESDPTTGASYFLLSDAPVARTVHISDLLMVDVDAAGDPVGVDVASPNIQWDKWLRLYETFPELKDVLGPFVG